MKIIVPATTANIGLGFDSIGIAVDLYLTLTVVEPSIEWKIEHPFGEAVPTNEENLIIETALAVCPTLQPQHLVCESDIPMTRGLGSSSSAIVAGIELANQLGKLNLTPQKKVEWATKIEGHPDNVAPAIFGNLCASCLVDDEAISVQYNVDERFNFMALIPNFETKTADARKALPKDLPLKDAIFSLSRLGIVLRAFETYDIQTLKKVLADKIHEPYRKNLIHEYDEVRSICENIESYGFFISGSGSTLINILVDETKLELIKEQLKNLKYNWKVLFTKVDKEGTTWKERNV